MTRDDEKLLAVLCDPVATTGEACGLLGVDALAIAVQKPSRGDEPAGLIVCLWRESRRHQWRAMGRGRTQRAALEEAERAGCRGGEWRFDAKAGEVKTVDLFAGVE